MIERVIATIGLCLIATIIAGLMTVHNYRLQAVLKAAAVAEVASLFAAGIYLIWTVE